MMNSTQLKSLLKPFSQVCLEKALSPINQALELTPTHARATCLFGTLEAKLDLGISQSFAVDGHTFLTLVASLIEGAPFELTVDNGVVLWKCGSSKGKFATLANIAIQPIVDTPAPGVVMTEQFASALRLGSLSSQNNAARSFGMYGVQINSTNIPTIYTCDDTTIASCVISETDGPSLKLVMPPMVTLSPPSANLLADVIFPGRGTLVFHNEDLIYEDENYKLRIRQLPPLKHNFAEIAAPFSHSETWADIMPERIQSFIKRAEALAETKKTSQVQMAVADGRLLLEFSHGVASTDEYMLTDDLKGINSDPVTLDSLKMARALTHVAQMSADQFDRQVLVFRSRDARFHYYVIGMHSK